jgi:hypothetical protein
MIDKTEEDDGRKVGLRERGVEIRTSQTRTSLPSITTITAEMYPLMTTSDLNVRFAGPDSLKKG